MRKTETAGKTRPSPTIQSRLFLFCASLVLIWFLCYNIFNVMHLRHSRALMSINDIQEEFAGFYSGLSELDRDLYHYCSREEDSRTGLKESIQKNLDTLTRTADSLRNAVSEPVVEDLYHIARTYTDAAETILSDDLENPSYSRLDGLYEDSAQVKQILENGYIKFWSTISLFCEQRSHEASSLLKWTNWLSFLVAAALTVVSILVSHRFSKKLLAPIRLAVETLHKEEENLRGDPQALPPQTAVLPAQMYSYREAQMLTEALRDMLETEHQNLLMRHRNSRLQEELQKERIHSINIQYRYAEAKYQMMQSLVNPHFLFNTLSVISDLALTEQAPRTQNAIGKLSVFLRYSLSHLNHFVPLQEEAEYLRTFFDIQKLRFGSRYRFLVDMDPDCENVQVPAIILQPLAENALSHGIGSYQSGGWVHFTISRQGGQVSIICSDNGVGMDAQQLRELRENLEKGLEEKPDHGIGLLLVYYRMHNTFKDDFHMTVESRPGVRTDIKLDFPAQTPAGATASGDAYGK